MNREFLEDRRKALEEAFKKGNLKTFEGLNQKVKDEMLLFAKQEEFKGKFPTKWIPSLFQVIEIPFSEENQMINSTLKMVRHKIQLASLGVGFVNQNQDQALTVTPRFRAIGIPPEIDYPLVSFLGWTPHRTSKVRSGYLVQYGVVLEPSDEFRSVVRESIHDPSDGKCGIKTDVDLDTMILALADG